MLKSIRAIAVLASGQGSNFEALAAAAARGELGATIVMLASDQAPSPALDRARRLGIEAVALPAGRLRTRLDDEGAWVRALRERGIDLIVLAGFMRRLHAEFLDAFPDRVLNIHPSLLPAFPGLDAVGQALRHGVRVTGCTVHLVTDEVDGGPILGQAAVDVRDGDTMAALETRVHETEHRLYPAMVRRFITEPWRREGGRIVFAPDSASGATRASGASVHA